MVVLLEWSRVPFPLPFIYMIQLEVIPLRYSGWLHDYRQNQSENPIAELISGQEIVRFKAFMISIREAESMAICTWFCSDVSSGLLETQE